MAYAHFSYRSSSTGVQEREGERKKGGEVTILPLISHHDFDITPRIYLEFVICLFPLESKCSIVKVFFTAVFSALRTGPVHRSTS